MRRPAGAAVGIPDSTLAVQGGAESRYFCLLTLPAALTGYVFISGNTEN